ncbi:hypothetical protein GDO81_026529 [Engystomops pustulosus]|uniref:Uncharacterized protein n=1 Tax=Engystomops pustulosus TaxID=76066 RepID=A0AAV6YMC4_ENGPU|nr:hypothetical protein GDO81_026529 [Engystomops pustulosus]
MQPQLAPPPCLKIIDTTPVFCTIFLYHTDCRTNLEPKCADFGRCVDLVDSLLCILPFLHYIRCINGLMVLSFIVVFDFTLRFMLHNLSGGHVYYFPLP